ncbi:hypothetical protein Cni_G08561 [Canna indica]|uniref:Uncharacterized protein n=1 Tax=Canna indica TaxID=4628 RepID=A0AAQ3Q8T2_9LILI|nr:hypothetical protein Cni_G08561 [Canna indica]
MEKRERWKRGEEVKWRVEKEVESWEMGALQGTPGAATPSIAVPVTSSIFNMILKKLPNNSQAILSSFIHVFSIHSGNNADGGILLKM